MNTAKPMFLLIGCLLALSACDLVGPDPIPAANRSDFSAAKSTPEIRVMTRNVSIGGDIDRVLLAPSMNDVPLLVAQTWQEIVTNDFHVRAAALAQEIKSRGPDVIGLQEITTLRIQDPGDMVFGGSEPAEFVVYDYLQILLDALAERGLSYSVAGSVADTDAEMPMVTSADPTFADVRMTDYDVVLVREGVEVHNVVAKNYDYYLPVDFGSQELPVLRGYVAIDASIGEQDFRFISTHLEPVSVPELQELQMAQAVELLGAMGVGTTIVVGDLNTGPGDPTYGLLASGGLSDAWSDLPGRAPGLTCCFAPDLLPGREFDKRFDLVLYRNGSSYRLVPKHGVISGRDVIEGAEYFPSDHAGLTVSFTVN